MRRALQPGIVATTVGLADADNAMVLVPIGHASTTRLIRLFFLDTSPPDPVCDLPTLFRALLI